MKQRVFSWVIVLLLGCASGVVAQPVQHPAGAAVGGDLLNLDWRVYVAAKPVYCILVEKDRQLLRVLRHDGRVQVVAEYVSGTGENFGRKEKEGDAKTPEGIYLITKRYLDRKMSVFGTRAFHLNYPNYFDIQDGRTGNGIFIHGTNRPLRLASSNGCVTMENEDLDNLASFLDINTPIFIVPSLAELHDADEYPNLTERDFAGAKALLIPEKESDADFASLYLISINGQTVVVGEYWPEQGSDVNLRKAIAYIQRTQDGRWFVADRGPTGEASSADAVMTIAGRAAWREESAGAGGDEIEPIGEDGVSGIWESSLADSYLSWRQSMLRSEQDLFSPTIQQTSEATIVAKSNRDGLIYGLFFLATFVSLSLAVVMIRRQCSRFGGATDSTTEAGFSPDGVRQAAKLREEVKRAMEMIQDLREQIDLEGERMAQQEQLEARIGMLEENFQGRQSALEALAAEQATLKQDREQGWNVQEKTLGALRLEVAEVKRHLDEVQNETKSTDVGSGIVQEQLGEIMRLLVEQSSAIQLGSEQSREVQVVCDQIQHRMLSLEEALESNKGSHCKDDEQQLDETLAALRASALTLVSLREEMASLRLETDPKKLEDILQGLRRDKEKQEAEAAEIKELRAIVDKAHLDLLSEKTVNASLFSEIAAREQEVKLLREAGERERQESESALSSLRLSLQTTEAREEESRREKEELALQLQLVDELQAEVAAGKAEITLLREAAERERQESESALSSLRLSLQTTEAREEESRREKEELALQLQLVDELQAEVAAGKAEITLLREAGERERQESESALSSLRLSLQTTEAREEESRREKEELALQLQLVDELQAEVAAGKAELTLLREAGERERQESESALSSLRLSLQTTEAREEESRREKEELVLQLQLVDELQAEVAAGKAELKLLREAAERERQESESALSSLRLSLQTTEAREEESRREKEELALQLQLVDELQAEVAAHEAEIRSLKEAGEQQRKEAEGKEGRIEADLSEVQVARQVERTHLVEELKAAEERAQSQRELAVELKRELGALQEDLRQVKERESASEKEARSYEQKVLALNDENRNLKVQMSEIGKRSVAGEGPTTIMKASPSLPDEVLRKWIGKEQ